MIHNFIKKSVVATASLSLILGINAASASAMPGLSSQAALPVASAPANAGLPSPNFAPQAQAPSHTVSVDGVVLNHQEARMVRLVNQYRASHGIAPLKVSQRLVNQSRNWSQVMANQDDMYHGPDNCYENVAWNNFDASADKFFNQWKASPGHNRNMLESRANYIGYGMKKNSSGNYYATMQLI